MSGGKILLLIAGAGIGAAAMALLEPGKGARRRSWMSDKMARGAHRSNRVIDKKARQLQNEAFGAIAERKARIFEGDIPDDVLEERVKAQIGHVLSQTRVKVQAQDGHITVEGPVLRGERQKLADRLDVTRGVKSYDLLVMEHDESEDFSNAQKGWDDERFRSA
jgi:hypothetical protein